MGEKRSTYRGLEIIIKEPSRVNRSAPKSNGLKTRALAKQTLKIGDKTIEVTQSGPKNFVSNELPYRSYKSLEELAREIIDTSPNFYPNATKKP